MSADERLVDLVLDVVVDAIRFRSSVLVQAAARGQHEVLQHLVQRLNALAVSVVDMSEFAEALWTAAGQGQALCLSALLESCTTPLHAKNLVRTHRGDGDTALISAARNGQAECVSQLLLHHPESQVKAANNSGSTALICAAAEGHAECVSLLLQHTPQVQVTAADGEGVTALICAAAEGHAECVSQLLQHSPKAQVSRTGDDGETALMCTARNGHAQCLDLLFGYSLQEQKLDGALLAALEAWDADLAAPSPHTRCLEQLLAKGALMPAAATAADREKGRLISQDLVSRALVVDRTNEAIVGLALAASSKKRKAGR